MGARHLSHALAPTHGCSAPSQPPTCPRHGCPAPSMPLPWVPSTSPTPFHHPWVPSTLYALPMTYPASPPHPHGLQPPRTCPAAQRGPFKTGGEERHCRGGAWQRSARSLDSAIPFRFPAPAEADGKEGGGSGCGCSGKMAATLRIQSDWCQALRWARPSRSPSPAPSLGPSPRTHRRSLSPQEGRGRGLAELPEPW